MLAKPEVIAKPYSNARPEVRDEKKSAACSILTRRVQFFESFYGRCASTLLSAKFDSSAVDNRFRQPALPFLTSNDSSQPKIQIEKGKINWNKEQ